MKIKCAAIRYNGKIFEGTGHAEIGYRMVREGICKDPYHSGEDQGFVTDCGRYVRREAALAIAIKAGQIKEGEHLHSTKLFSEDFRPK